MTKIINSWKIGTFPVRQISLLFLTMQVETVATVVPCLHHWYEDWHTIVLLLKWPPHYFLWMEYAIHAEEYNFLCLVFLWMFAWPACYLLLLACLNNLLHSRNWMVQTKSCLVEFRCKCCNILKQRRYHSSRTISLRVWLYGR